MKLNNISPDGDDDDEVTVIEVISLELGGDNNNDTGGLNTLDGVEVILISISIIYTYIFRNIYFYFSTITSISSTSIQIVHNITHKYLIHLLPFSLFTFLMSSNS